MASINIVFTCHERPQLTELCLRRLVELMPKPYTLVLAYDGDDIEYVNRLLNIYEFDYIVTNEGHQKTRFALINDALDFCEGDFYMHLENDFYWSREGTIRRAFEAFAKVPELDYIRFEYIPFTERSCQRVINLSDDKLCVLRNDAPFQFTFNPHIRRDKFPIGRFPEEKITDRQPEGLFAELWAGTGKLSGCLMGENFRHIGIYDEAGHYKEFYAERFHLRRGDKTLDPLPEFKKFCKNSYHQLLFKKYLENR